MRSGELSSAMALYLSIGRSSSGPDDPSPSPSPILPHISTGVHTRVLKFLDKYKSSAASCTLLLRSG
jgi:hypothetical protein